MFLKRITTACVRPGYRTNELLADFSLNEQDRCQPAATSAMGHFRPRWRTLPAAHLRFAQKADVRFLRSLDRDGQKVDIPSTCWSDAKTRTNPFSHCIFVA